MTGTRWIPDNPPSETLPLWTRANVGEVLPDPPTPLSWDLVWEHGTLMGWRDCAVNRLGTPESELSQSRPEVSGIFGGYGYLNATSVRLFGERAPGMSADAIDRAYFGDHPDVPPYVREDWHVRPESVETVTAWLGWVMLDRDTSDLEQDRRLAEQVRAERPDLTSLSNDELIGRANGLIPLIRQMFDQHINQSAAASMGPGVIGAVAEAIGEPTLTLKIISGLGGVDSAAPSFALWEMSRQVRASDALNALFDDGPRGLTDRLRASEEPAAAALLADLDGFLVEYGSRGPNEWDIHAHTWETDPDLVMAAIDRMRLASDEGSPVRSHAGKEAEREAIVASVTEALAADPDAQGQFVAAVHSAATFVPGRERSKTSIINVIHESRLAMWELGRRLMEQGGCGEPRDICLLFADELDRAFEEPRWAAATIGDRQSHFDHLKTLEPPFLINGVPPDQSGWARRADAAVDAAVAGDTILGVPGSAGTYRGTARVVLDPSDPTVLGPGEILVAPHTDPAWTPLFVAAGAVVVDVGAALSHAIIVSRELGLPCVVSATDATKRISDGAEIEVNGDLGTVTIL